MWEKSKRESNCQILNTIKEKQMNRFGKVQGLLNIKNLQGWLLLLFWELVAKEIPCFEVISSKEFQEAGRALDGECFSSKKCRWLKRIGTSSFPKNSILTGPIPGPTKS